MTLLSSDVKKIERGSARRGFGGDFTNHGSTPLHSRPHARKMHHRVDSVIESSFREIIGSQNFALINLSLYFCETIIYDNKVFLENLVAVH